MRFTLVLALALSAMLLPMPRARAEQFTVPVAPVEPLVLPLQLAVPGRTTEQNRAEVRLLDQDGALAITYHCPLAYQRHHSFLILFYPEDAAGEGFWLRCTPWSMDTPPYTMGKLTRERGIADSTAEIAGVSGIFKSISSKAGGGWEAQIHLAVPLLEGATRLRAAFSVAMEFGQETLPTGGSPTNPETFLTLSFDRPLAPARALADTPIGAAALAESARNLRIERALDTVGKLSQIRDMKSLVRVSKQITDDNPDCAAAWIAYAAQLGASGDLSASIQIIERLRERFPAYNGLPSEESLAHSLLTANLWERARAALAELPADNQRRQIDEAMLAYHLGDFKEARDRMQALLTAGGLPKEKVDLIKPFLDYSTEYAGALFEAEKASQLRDAEGEALPRAVLVFDAGEVEIELFENDAPNTVANFIQLAAEGFYDGTSFHRVVANSLVQGGCPNTKNDVERDDGLGGPAFRIRTETSGRRHFRGTLGMANSGTDTERSQFYISVSTNAHLNQQHTVFGRVLRGMEIVDTLKVGSLLKAVKLVSRRDHPYVVEKLPLVPVPQETKTATEPAGPPDEEGK